MTCRAQYDRTPLEGGPRSAGPVEAALSRRPLRDLPGMEIRVGEVVVHYVEHPPDLAIMPHRRSR